MKYTLHLSSPHMHGELVTYAQRLLKNNRFHVDVFLDVDGEYGPETAAATQHTKYMLGYPQKDVNSNFGTQLELYLRDEKPRENLPLAYRIRRARRLKQMSNFGERALRIAERYIGTKEHPPESNIAQPFSHWYRGYVGPWCAVFASFCYEQAGSKAPEAGFRWAYCPTMVYNARYQAFGLRAIHESQVRPGDLVLYDWGRDGVSDHVGLFKEWLRPGVFHAVEGNTAIGNDSNGGEVMQRERYVSNVICWARVEK